MTDPGTPHDGFITVNLPLHNEGPGGKREARILLAVRPSGEPYPHRVIEYPDGSIWVYVVEDVGQAALPGLPGIVSHVCYSDIAQRQGASEGSQPPGKRRRSIDRHRVSSSVQVVVFWLCWIGWTLGSVIWGWGGRQCGFWVALFLGVFTGFFVASASSHATAILFGEFKDDDWGSGQFGNRGP